MKGLSRMLLALLYVLTWGVGSAQAQLALTLREGQGLTQAMRNAGCDLGWLARVMYWNHVMPENLRRLEVGSTYQINFDCAAKPPEQERFNSEAIMWADRTHATRTIVRTVQQPATPIPSRAAEDVQPLQNRITTLEQENQNLREQGAGKDRLIEQNQKELQKLVAGAVQVREVVRTSGWTWFWGVLFVLAAAGLLLFWSRYRAEHDAGLADKEAADKRHNDLKQDRDNLFEDKKRLRRELETLKTSVPVNGKENPDYSKHVIFPTMIRVAREEDGDAAFELVGVEKRDNTYVGCYHCPDCPEKHLLVERENVHQIETYNISRLQKHLGKHAQPLPTPPAPPEPVSVSA